MSDKSPVRIGAVSYLNTKPLIESLPERDDRIDLSLEIPSRLSQKLNDDELDVALVPSVEVFRTPGAKVLSNACIGCCGPVWSVKLISRKPIHEIKTLALDEGSRTSVGLVQILLKRKHDILPLCKSLPIHQSPEESSCDAILLIGDRAMNLSYDVFRYQWDLGEEWFQWTGLPFVFAMWVTLAKELDPAIVAALSGARDFGVGQIDEIAKREAPLHNLSVSQCASYLRDNLHFTIGEKEREGLKLYQSQLLELNLISESNELEFYEYQTS